MVLKFQGYKKCVNSTRDKMCFRNAGERITALNSFRRAESYERGTDRDLIFLEIGTKSNRMISPLPLQLKLSRCWAQKLCTSRFWVQLWSDCGVEGSPGTSMLQHQLWQFPHHSEVTSILMPGQHSTAQQYVFSKCLVSTTLSEEQIGFIDFCCKESCLLKAL